MTKKKNALALIYSALKRNWGFGAFNFCTYMTCQLPQLRTFYSYHTAKFITLQLWLFHT